MPNLNSPRLILSPEKTNFYFSDFERLLAQLLAAEFIGKELDSAGNYRCFDLGESFLHQITFLGCSPTIYSDADPENRDIFVSIAQHDLIQFAHSSSMPPARCPHCHKTDSNWQQYFQHWTESAELTETCPQCGKKFHFTEMKWKKNGGYGRLLIQIHGIQEQLAIPNQILLDELEKITNTRWVYFFAS